MDLNRGGVSVGQHVSDSSGPGTSGKSTTIKRAVISVINGQGVTAFESVVDVPVALLASLSEKSASNSPDLSITPPFAPVTPGNSKSKHHCNPQQVIHFVSENLNDVGSLQEFDKLQTVPVHQQMDLCANNGFSSLVAPTTPYMTVPSKHANSSPEGVSLQFLESEKDEDDEALGIDLNKTPRKKFPRRKKHRPKVIRESKPIKSPRPVTPKTVENKENSIPKRTCVRKSKDLNSLVSPPSIMTPPSVTEENKEKPIVMKTYVRKRKALNLNSDIPSVKIGEISIPCSSTNVKVIDKLPKNETKSVRRSLNFTSEDETMSICHITTINDVESAPWSTVYEGATVCNSELKGKLTQGLEEVVTKPPAGIVFDLNRSPNQLLDEYIKLPGNPDPISYAPSSRRETTRKYPKFSDSTKDAESNMDIQNDHDKIDSNSHPDIILIDDDSEKTGTMENYNHIDALQDCSAKSPVDVCFLHDDKKQTSLFHEYSGLSPYLPMIYKKRRTERVYTLGDDKALLPKVSRCFTFADAQWTMPPVSLLQQSSLMNFFDPTQRPTRKRSKLATRARKPVPMGCVADHGRLLGPIRDCLPPSCMDALVADTHFKITKRPRKKGHFRLLSSVLSSIKQECQISMNKFCFLEQPFVLGLAASHWKSRNQLQERPLQNFYSRSSNAQRYFLPSKNFQSSFHANFQPQAFVPYIDSYMDPVELTVERMKRMRISGDLMKYTDEANNSLIPYAGSSMMVPYRSVFDIIKKQRPRAKVDLDPETNRVWNLLMGKKSNVEADGVNMDKEKWWEEEREVFRGRADAFIARMHLILGDRRFSKWKGSVVDSVVGVFLTQNVADHLSSSAFMSMAARFPLQLRSNEKANAENMNISKKEDGKILGTDTIKQQENMSTPVAIYPSSMRSYTNEKEDNDFSSSFGSYSGSAVDCSKGMQFLGRDQQIVTEPPQNWMQISASETGLLNLEASENRMNLEDVFLTQTSFSSLEDSSEYQNQTAGQVDLCSEAVTLVDDLAIKTRCSNYDSPTSFMSHSWVEDASISHESYNNCDVRMLDAEDTGAGDEGVACRIELKEKLCGPGLVSPSANTSNFLANHQQNIFETVSAASYTSHLITNSLNTRPIGTEIADMVRADGSFLPSAALETKTYDINIVEGSSTDWGTLLDSVSAMTDESHVSRSQLNVQMPNCSESQLCLEKHVGYRDSLSAKKIKIPLRDIPYKHSHSHNAQLVEVHQEERETDLPAEKTPHEIEVLTTNLNCREQTVYQGSCNDSKEIPENAKAVQLELKNEGCKPQDLQPERGMSTSRTKMFNAEAEKMFEWEDLRKEAFANGAENKRTSETMDSVDWEAVRKADVNEISMTIRERGMNNVLAQRIKNFLNRLVRDHGSIDLEWLRSVSPDEAKDYLLSIHGLGLKSVECVRLLTLHHLAFPVDTNVGRICVRLGWVPLQPLPESLQLHLLELYPMLEHIQKYLWPRLCTLDQRTLYELHYQMITFGKVFCTKNKPNCNACPMRGECKHFASAFASARLALPGPEERRLVTSRIRSTFEDDRSQDFGLIPLHQLEGSQSTECSTNICNGPIIEEPASPEQPCTHALERDIEDAFYDDSEEIPTIKLSSEEFKKNLKLYMQENNLEIQDDDMSKALVTITADTASIPMPKLKNVNRLRTEHQVYELPDSHPLLKEMDHRIPDDPCPYLLAIWTPGETEQSTEPPQSCCDFQDSVKSCDRITCFACNSRREAQTQTVRGTILIPCRTAMRGSFPLNGTYFQVNEVFADHNSSRVPIDVPRKWIWNLPRRTVFFGTSIPTIFKGLTMEDIQHCFWRGFVCVRGFERTTRAPRPLYARLHFPASKAPANRKTAGKEQGSSSSTPLYV